MSNDNTTNNAVKWLSSTTLGHHFDLPTLSAFYFQLIFSDEKNSSENFFQEVSGIGLNLETEAIAEHENTFVHQLPKSPKRPNLILKRGLINNNSPLAQWCREVMEADFTKPSITKSLCVHLKSYDGDTLCTWNFTDAHPVIWKLISLNTNNNELAVESIELSYSSCTNSSLAFI